MVLNDANGNLLGASIAEDGQWRFPESDSIPEKVATCIQYFEDRHFYRHPGVNPISLIRATWQNVSSGEVISGASTITMQIARMMRGEQRTIWQKIIEMAMALKLELKYSKSSLMIKYLSMAPFGGNVVGIDAASWRYFNRPAHLLSWGEAAALAVLPNNPGAIYPGRSDIRFREKRNRLLQRLVAYQVIDTTTYELSLLEDMPGKPFPIPQNAPHLLSTIEQKQPGKMIHSTLDPYWQDQVSKIVKRHHLRQWANGVENLCALVVDLKTDQVLAYVGNTSNINAQGHQVDIIQKPRSPGSSLKPLLYAHSLSRGIILPQTLLPDIPTFFGGYSPKNFSEGYDGMVAADVALARSLNIPFVYLLRDHTYEQFHHDLKKLGITTLTQPPGHYGLSLILGGAEVTLWDLANSYVKLYQKLARKKASDISFVKDAPGKSSRPTPDAASIWYTFQAMTELTRPDEENNWQTFSSSQLISWKTGTSFGFRDAWAVGLNGSVFVGVWMGNADGEGRSGLTGINAAAPLFLEIMRLSTHDPSWLERLKPSMQTRAICATSGLIANTSCPTRKEEMPPQAQNSGICPYHKEIYMDASLTYRVNSSCYSLARATKKTWFVLPPAVGHYYSRANASYPGLPSLYPSCISNEKTPIQIIYPTPNSKVFLPKSLDGEKNNLILEASHQNKQAKLFWSIGSDFFGSTSGEHKLEVALPKGLHTLKLTDQDGNEIKQTFEVINNL